MNSPARLLALTLIVFLTAACAKKEAGRPCSTDKQAICLEDGVLTCNDGKWVASACRGPKGCSVNQSFVECDTSLADNGDRCMSDGNFACSTDGRALLRCANQTYVVDETCTAGTNCKIVGNQAGCQ